MSTQLSDPQDQGAYSRWAMHMEVGRIAYEEGLYSAAARNLRCALAAADSMGFTSEETLPGCLCLAKCCCELGNFAEAEHLYKIALGIDLDRLGSYRYDFIGGDLTSYCSAIATDLNELAGLYLKSGRLEEAQKILTRSQQIAESSCKDDTLLIASVEKNLAQLCCRQGLLLEAQKHAEKALSICTDKAERHSKLYSEVLLARAQIAAKEGCYAKAEEYIVSAISNFEMLTGGAHPELADFLDFSAKICRLEKLPTTADSLEQRARAMRNHLKMIDR